MDLFLIQILINSLFQSLVDYETTEDSDEEDNVDNSPAQKKARLA